MSRNLVLDSANAWEKASAAINEARGQFLGEMLMTEDIMDDAILSLFRPDEATMFGREVLDRLGFRRKVKVLRAFATRIGIDAEHADLFKDLNDLYTQRNDLAHRSVYLAAFNAGGPVGRWKVRSGSRPGDPSSGESEHQTIAALRRSAGAAGRVRPRLFALWVALRTYDEYETYGRDLEPES